MRPYETLVVLSNELAGEMEGLVKRFESLIGDNGGSFETCRDWGNRRLAYPIKKKGDGHYYLFEYAAEPAVVSELERTLRITDGVLRYMSVQQEHTGLPQARPREAPGREDVPFHEMPSHGHGPRGGGGRPGGERDDARSAAAPARPAAAATEAPAASPAPAATGTPAQASPAPAGEAAAPAAEPTQATGESSGVKPNE